ncbi:hypothetical protein [Streptacidiphilus sp. EB129]|jgi:hypothetical protein|uniref:hypothetical protein n=1 Tax=Streptacidiphilus sp. EB129 TaxID=3156262 RepID=UPI0035194FDA
MPTQSVRRAALAATAAGLVAAAPLACAQSARAAAYPPVPGGFSVSASLVIAGGHLVFSATLPGGQQIVLNLVLPTLPPTLPLPLGARASRSVHRVPLQQQLATFTADAEGHVSGEVTIPANTTPGVHLLTLTPKGSNKVLSVPVLVSLPSNAAENTYLSAATVAYKKPLIRSASSLLSAQAAAAAGLAVGGAAAVTLLRRRRRDQD